MGCQGLRAACNPAFSQVTGGQLPQYLIYRWADVVLCIVKSASRQDSIYHHHQARWHDTTLLQLNMAEHTNTAGSQTWVQLTRISSKTLRGRAAARWA